MREQMLPLGRRLHGIGARIVFGAFAYNQPFFSSLRTTSASVERSTLLRRAPITVDPRVARPCELREFFDSLTYHVLVDIVVRHESGGTVSGAQRVVFDARLMGRNAPRDLIGFTSSSPQNSKLQRIWLVLCRGMRRIGLPG